MSTLPHQDVEFHATKARNETAPWFCKDYYFDSWLLAKAFLGDEPGTIDVVIWSEEGAEAYGGSDAVEQYRVDPEASVFERWIRTERAADFNCQGMVP